MFHGIARTLCVVTPYILLALGAPLLLPSLLDKAPRQGDIQEFAAARRIANAIGWVFWLGICDHMHGLYVMGDTT